MRLLKIENISFFSILVHKLIEKYEILKWLLQFMMHERRCRVRKVLREEKKYLITYQNYISSNHYFSQTLHPDIHNKEDGYIIRSLYFDTLFDDDFYHKIDGLEIRRKIRLRIYSPDDDFAYLEMKQKQGNYQQKRSLKISKENAIRLINKEYQVLLETNDPFGIEMYTIMSEQHYIPKTINQYRRKAYVVNENSTRITFDSDIRATETSFDLFSKNLLLNPVFDQNYVVLEVKYNGFLLSYVKDIINSIDRIQTPVSKYCLGRTNTIKYIY